MIFRNKTSFITALKFQTNMFYFFTKSLQIIAPAVENLSDVYLACFFICDEKSEIVSHCYHKKYFLEVTVYFLIKEEIA